MYKEKECLITLIPKFRDTKGDFTLPAALEVV